MVNFVQLTRLDDVQIYIQVETIVAIYPEGKTMSAICVSGIPENPPHFCVKESVPMILDKIKALIHKV